MASRRRVSHTRHPSSGFWRRLMVFNSTFSFFFILIVWQHERGWGGCEAEAAEKKTGEFEGRGEGVNMIQIDKRGVS